MPALYANLNHVSVVLISLAIILFAGFGMTRITKRMKLPNVSGFIIAGILIGPYALNLVSADVIQNMDFVSDIALSFIAFGVGKFFKISALRSCGPRVVVITLLESLLAGAAVTFALKFFFGTSWTFALLAGAIATATAPASTVMTIRQYHAKGPFVDTLMQVVAFDDVVALLAFSAAAAVASSFAAGTFQVWNVLLPVLYHIGAVGLGFLCGFLLSKLTVKRSQDNRLILVVAMLLGLSGVCSIADISPLLACMAFGAVYINLTADRELFRQADHFSPPLLSCFFILSGMRLNLTALRSAGLIGIVYFLVRIAGKYAGAFAGCAVCRTDKKIRNFLGIALIPQAGVAIGLAVLGQRLLPADMGELLSTVILTSSVLYELIGPVSAKLALVFSGAIVPGPLISAESTDLAASSASDGSAFSSRAEEPPAPDSVLPDAGKFSEHSA